MILTNFASYIPTDEDKKNIHDMGLGIAFWCTEDGQDWYESQHLFAADSVKLVFDQNHIVRQISADVSAICPSEGMSVAEISPESVPEECWLNASEWMFDGVSIIKRTYSPAELGAQAESTKTELLETAAKKIAPLQDAEELEIATAEEREALKAWKKYRVLLNRVDTSKASDIEWPEPPEDVA